MNKSTFFIIGKHAVIEALKNPKRKVLRVFLTEESKKNIHRENQKQNILQDIKIHFKTKKELDKYTSQDNLMHQGYVAEIEHIEKLILKDAALLIKEPMFLGSVTSSKHAKIKLFLFLIKLFKTNFSRCSISAT